MRWWLCSIILSLLVFSFLLFLIFVFQLCHNLLIQLNFHPNHSIQHHKVQRKDPNLTINHNFNDFHSAINLNLFNYLSRGFYFLVIIWAWWCLVAIRCVWKISEVKKLSTYASCYTVYSKQENSLCMTHWSRATDIERNFPLQDIWGQTF